MIHRAVVRLYDASTVDAAALAQLTSWLDESERQRLPRFVRHERRTQFIVGRVLARQALGAVLGLAPSTVRLVERPGAAPVLASPTFERASFSISHSGRWIACAASATAKVGLDVEVVDPTRDIASLAAQAFDPDQLAWLAARPAETRLSDFYRTWSTLEASFKLGAAAVSTFDLSRSELSIIVCCDHALTLPPELEYETLC